MVYQRISKLSSGNSHIHKKDSASTVPKIPVQAKSDSASSQKQEMPSYTPLAANWATNNNLMRSLNNAEAVQRQEESAEEEMEPIQAKLTIGEVGDKYEQEADDTASKVVQQINSPTQDKSVQKQESMEEEEELQMKPISSIQREAAMEEDEELQMKPISSIQRESAMEEDEELQMKSLVQRRENLGGGEASSDLEASIQSARGGGQSLDAGLQTKMGEAMGADFSDVKVHTDSQSDQLNKSIQAKAFTTGQDVFFRQGAYDPSSKSGQELIAHELTHVVQQKGTRSISRNIYRSTDLNHSPKCNCSNCSGISQISSGLTTLNRKHEKYDSQKVTDQISPFSNRSTIQRDLSEDMTKEEFIQELSQDDNLRKRINHIPSTGLGRFDAEYDASTDNLIVTVKTYFQFGDKGISGNFEEGIGGWLDTEKTDFITKFKNQAESAWSDKFKLTCQKAGFETLSVTPIIRFESVDSYDQAHFNHKIAKNNPVMGTGIGREQDDDPNNLNVGNFKLADAVVGVQGASTCNNIAGHDKARLIYLMEGYKVGEKNPLEFKSNGSSELDSKSKNRLTLFARKLVETSRMGSVPVPIIAVGVDNKSERKSGANKSQKRANTVSNFLINLIQGVPNNRPNPVNTEVFDEGTVDTAKQEYKSKNTKLSRDAAKKEYDKLAKLSNRRHAYLKPDMAFQWTGDAYSVLAHEFGHMLGNSDEYFQWGDEAIKDQTIKSLIETKKPENIAKAANLSKLKPGPDVTKAKTQQNTFDLANKAGTDLPEFNSTSSSIMSAGTDVLPVHYLPIWEVLGKITSPAIKPEEWKIG